MLHFHVNVNDPGVWDLSLFCKILPTCGHKLIKWNACIHEFIFAKHFVFFTLSGQFSLKSLEKLTHNVTSVFTDGRDAITNFTRTKQVFPWGLKAQTESVWSLSSVVDILHNSRHVCCISENLYKNVSDSCISRKLCLWIFVTLSLIVVKSMCLHCKHVHCWQSAYILL